MMYKLGAIISIEIFLVILIYLCYITGENILAAFFAGMAVTEAITFVEMREYNDE